MRTPNAKCCVCAVPLYRRPGNLRRVRHVACMAHRAEAQRRDGQTDRQKQALALGRAKGTNHRDGYTHRPESRRKASESYKAWCAAHPERVAARGEKTRGEAHYNWKGGVTRLNTSIRRMDEYRKWAAAVRGRDGTCVRCHTTRLLEAHHKTELSAIIKAHGIDGRRAARTCAALWDVSNGTTLCRKCHYAEHGRRYVD